MNRLALALAAVSVTLAAAPGASSMRSEVSPGGSGWTATARAFRADIGRFFRYTCPAGGSVRKAWGGLLNVYTDDSSVCTAAVHAGWITLARGGTVFIQMKPGQSSYRGGPRYGVTTGSWGAWGGSFKVTGAVKRLKGSPAAGGSTWYANATGFRDQNGSRYTYSCPAGGTPGAVWGSGVYTDDSSVCTAAVHAGKITLANGGTVTIEIRQGESSYAGTTQNGITTRSFGVWHGSYVFVG